MTVDYGPWKTWIKAQSYNNKEPDSERVCWQAEGERDDSSQGSVEGSGRTPPVDYRSCQGSVEESRRTPPGDYRSSEGGGHTP